MQSGVMGSGSIGGGKGCEPYKGAARWELGCVKGWKVVLRSGR